MGQVAVLQPAPQSAIAAVDLIGGHPAARHTSVQGPLQHHPSKLWLGLELHLLGDAGHPAALPVSGPALGQVQLPIDQGMPAGASVGQEHPDLAVLDPPGRPGVLTLHPGRLGALLEEPGLVHHQHPTRVAQVLYDIAAQVSTDLVGIPTSMVEQPLHPVRGVLTGVLGQLPTILAFHPCQQTTQERSCPTADLDPAEPRRDPLAQRRQLARPLLHLRHPGLHLLTPLLHPATAKRAGYPRKVRL